MTAEFAVALSGVLLVLALCLGAVGLLGQQLALASLASSGARMLARGDGDATMRARVAEAAPGVRIAQSADGGFVCVTLERRASFGPVGLAVVELSARGCALGAEPAPEGSAEGGS